MHRTDKQKNLFLSLGQTLKQSFHREREKLFLKLFFTKAFGWYIKALPWNETERFNFCPVSLLYSASKKGNDSYTLCWNMKQETSHSGKEHEVWGPNSATL